MALNFWVACLICCSEQTPKWKASYCCLLLCHISEGQCCIKCKLEKKPHGFISRTYSVRLDTTNSRFACFRQHFTQNCISENHERYLYKGWCYGRNAVPKAMTFSCKLVGFISHSVSLPASASQSASRMHIANRQWGRERAWCWEESLPALCPLACGCCCHGNRGASSSRASEECFGYKASLWWLLPDYIVHPTCPLIKTLIVGVIALKHFISFFNFSWFCMILENRVSDLVLLFVFQDGKTSTSLYSNEQGKKICFSLTCLANEKPGSKQAFKIISVM